MPQATVALVKVHLPQALNPNFHAEPSHVLRFLETEAGMDWSAHSGSGTLGLYSGGRALLLNNKPGLGFLVRHVADEGAGAGDVVKRNDDFSKAVELSVGGSRQRVPEALLVNLEAASAAVKHFFRTGEKVPSLEWTPAGPALANVTAES